MTEIALESRCYSKCFYRKVIVKVKIDIIYIPLETEVQIIFPTIKSELTDRPKLSVLTWFLSSSNKMALFPFYNWIQA